MVKIIHCPSCYQISEIRSDNEEEMISPPTYCPFCGYQEDHEAEHGVIQIQNSEVLN